MILKLFNLDLHISVISDFEYILNRLFPFDFKLTSHSMSGRFMLLEKQICNNYIINPNNWKMINQKMIELFYNFHQKELKEYDGFVVTHTPSFALLYEKFNKPVIVINSTRYEQPASHTDNLEQWNWINTGLKRMSNNGLLLVVSNNLFDKFYLKQGTDIDSIHLPSLCLYTSVSYCMINKERVQYLLYSSIKKEFENIIPESENIININMIKPYKYIDLIKARGIIHIPYEISTMSVFEQYSMNIPLIFPTKQLLINMFKTNMINFYGSYVNLFKTKTYPENLKNLLDENWFETMISYADYYDDNNMPYITYFDSFNQLPDILNNLDSNDISNKMKQFNMKRKLKTYENWSRLLIDKFNLGQIKMDILCKNIDKIITTDRYLEKITQYNKTDIIKYYKTDFIFKDGIWRGKNINRYNIDSDILVNGHSDYEMNQNMIYILTLKNKPSFIYSINSNNISKKSLGLPLGITNYCNDSSVHCILGDLKIMEEVHTEFSNTENRDNLVLLNINKSTYPEREKVYDKFSKEKYVTTLDPTISIVGRKNYLIDITKHDFVLCPRGNGIDTHRLWETLYMERIPIVIYTDIHPSFIGLPILFINSWDEINENFLKEKLIEIKSKKWMWNKIYIDYWLNLIPK
jgi:hypothetical protein